MALRIEARVSASWLRASPAGKMVLWVERAADWLRRRWVVEDLSVVLPRPRGSSAEEEEESEIGGLPCGLEPLAERGGLSEAAGGTPLLGGGGPAPLLRLSWLSMGSVDVRDSEPARSFSVFRGMLLFPSDDSSRPRDDDGAATVSPASKPLPSCGGGPGPMAEEALGISIQGLKCRPKDAWIDKSRELASASGCSLCWLTAHPFRCLETRGDSLDETSYCLTWVLADGRREGRGGSPRRRPKPPWSDDLASEHPRTSRFSRSVRPRMTPPRDDSRCQVPGPRNTTGSKKKNSRCSFPRIDAIVCLLIYIRHVQPISQSDQVLLPLRLSEPSHSSWGGISFRIVIIPECKEQMPPVPPPIHPPPHPCQIYKSSVCARTLTPRTTPAAPDSPPHSHRHYSPAPP